MGPASNPWWKVDLGREGLVTGVRLALGVPYHEDAGRIINVTVTNNTGDSRVCTTVFELFVPELVNHVVMSCDEPLLGRHVQVEMIDSEICNSLECGISMFLNEVEVVLGKEFV